MLRQKLCQKQIIETLNDGFIIMEIDTSGRLDLKQWVLSLGAEARVLKPEELRRELADEVERMAVNLHCSITLCQSEKSMTNNFPTSR